MTVWDDYYAKLRTDKLNTRIVMLGDSTTEGNVSVTNGGWPHQLRLIMEANGITTTGAGLWLLNRDPWAEASPATTCGANPLSGGTLTVASTAGFATFGTLAVAGTTQTILAYTGIGGGTTFTGCTVLYGPANPAGGGAVTTGWQRPTATDAWDKAPNLGAWQGTSALRGHGANYVFTWTKPAGTTVRSFKFYVVDHTDAGQFSYSIDGGAWTNVSTTWAQNSTVKTLTVQAKVATSVRVRAADAAGTAIPVYMIGMSTRDGTGGATLHNFGSNGDALAYITGRSTTHWGATFTEVAPSLVTCMFYNDHAFVGQWQANLVAFGDYVINTLGAACLFMVYFEGPDFGYRADEAQMRTDMHAAAATLGAGCKVLDLRTQVGGGYDVSGPTGLVYQGIASPLTDDVHANNAGVVWIAQQVWGVIGAPRVGAKSYVP